MFQQAAVQVLDEQFEQPITKPAQPIIRDEARERREDQILIAALGRVDATAVKLFTKIRLLDAVLAISTGRNAGSSAIKDPCCTRADLLVQLRARLGNNVLQPSVLRLDLDDDCPSGIVPLDWECAGIQRDELLFRAGPFDVMGFLGARGSSSKNKAAAIAYAVGADPDDIPVLRDARNEPIHLGSRAA